MATNTGLDRLQDVEGVLGAALFTPEGEVLDSTSGGRINLKAIGILANNTLNNAQKAAVEMGTGRANMVHVEAEAGHILALCLNDGKSPFKTEEGKAHLHLIVALSPSCNLGLIKMTAPSVIRALANELTTA
ncbi:MAG: roadblock/LC7 domain-containing protein [bacterium]|nr:roadblock/LC7 domain-containing protein [bacterium]